MDINGNFSTSENASESESVIATTVELINEAKAGRPFILVDAEDRENEGDIIIPAEFASADQINFMARYARGLICLALTSDQAKKLKLKPSPQQNISGRATAFTIPIEAASGVTTGISAHDRARTVSVAIAENSSHQDIATPGHVFPLIAKDGGVLIRAGHTEAGVDIARLSGLTPAAVICEIMKDDGEMARLPDLIPFAKEHGLKIGTIANLIEYIRRTEGHVRKIHEQPYETSLSDEFTLTLFRNELNGSEHVAIIKGAISPDKPTLVRMHRVNILTDLLNSKQDSQNPVETALQRISEHDGPGVIVLINDPDPGYLSRTISRVPADKKEQRAQRDYGLGAQILISLGVHNMVLLTNSTARLAALEGYNLHILARKTLQISPN